MAGMSVQRRDEYQFGTVLPSNRRFVPLWPNISVMDRCASIARVRDYFDWARWASLLSGVALGAYELRDGDRSSALGRMRKPVLIAAGGATVVSWLGKSITEVMLNRCTNRVLAGVGALPLKSRAESVPDRLDETIDPDERSVLGYAVSAEAIARRATSPTAIAKGILVVAAATALAAVSAGLSMIGFRGSAVTPGFGVMVDGESDLYGRRNTIL